MLRNAKRKLRNAAIGLSALLFVTAVPLSGLVNKAYSKQKQQTQQVETRRKDARVDIKFVEKVQRTEQHRLYLKIWKARRKEEWKKFGETESEMRGIYPGHDRLFPSELEVFVEELIQKGEFRKIDDYLYSKEFSLKKKAQKALQRHVKHLFDEVYPGMSESPSMNESAEAEISSTIKVSIYDYDDLSMIMKIVGKEYGRLLYKGSPLQAKSGLEQKVLQETAHDMLGNDFSFRYAKEFFRSELRDHDQPYRCRRYLDELFEIEDEDKTILEAEFGSKIADYPSKYIRKKLSFLIRELGPYFFVDTTKYLTNFNELDYTCKLARETSRINSIKLKQCSIQNQEVIKDLLEKGMSGWELRKELVRESILLHELYDRLPKVKGVLGSILDIFKKNDERGVNQ